MTFVDDPQPTGAAAYSCLHPGCPANAARGDVILRTSPKGQPFAGMCREHHPDRLDPVETALYDALKGEEL